jgi:hypothetical protein
MKHFFEYIRTKQNKEITEEMKHDSVTEIEKSMKSPELESERLHRELLQSLGSETGKCTDLRSQVKKVI